MEKVLLPERIIDEGLELLKDKAEIIITKDASEQSIIDEVSDAFAIILRSKAKITRSIIEAAPKLKVISRTGAGYDNVDVQAATEHNVMVCNLPGINTVAVAEHTISLMLALLKQLPKMDLYVRNGQWGKRSEFISEEAFGKTIGIVGLGKIGREVMFRCKSMGMHVLVYDPYVENALKDNDIRFCNDVETLFTQSDVITLHVPNIPENKKMVDEHLIRLMKPTAYIINTSRGEVIDQGALTSALKEHRIAGAGLDVFAQEPIEQDDPLLTLDNVILTPHAAALSRNRKGRPSCSLQQSV
ncbi:hydroxyacid dehydrogenase [Mahella sp.]|uniref:hydroxyacid dehydrogenase n=1 Tax=Mahella sp. TaxID=2798721 RepID=UPI0025BB6A9F|nr:hydroxyacid dehydrogenase [Mahella sp.]MBZ4664824.1 Phosphoglycerate dehydrogenase [Mahella sp.]